MTRDLPAQDVRSLVISLAMTWSPASLTYTGATDDPDAGHQRHRDSLATAVHRALGP
ncbi:hypothetical protein [Streptomyces sp. NPDC058632]|uniref:hypothetical protein n=1 Tax=unclassified Streptomyces TaxID=2593676 RepID=UPI00365CD924